MDVREAFHMAEAEGQILRVRIKDGEPQMGTTDYVPTRINVAVEADRSLGIVGIG